VPENAATKARRLLAEARIRILEANDYAGTLAAEVRGDSSAVYVVAHDADGWHCTCPTRGLCSHVRALMLVTVMAPRKTP
jgi:uncharacterized Zn finger protein